MTESFEGRLRPEERLAHDAGNNPETVTDRDNSPEDLAKDAGGGDLHGSHADAPEQIAKDAGERPEIVEGVADVPEQLAKDAADTARD